MAADARWLRPAGVLVGQMNHRERNRCAIADGNRPASAGFGEGWWPLCED